MAGDQREAEHQSRLSRRLRVLLPVLAVILAVACVANIWFSLSVRDDAPTGSMEAAAGGWDPKYENLASQSALSPWLSYTAAFGFGLAVPAVWILGLLGSYVRWKLAVTKVARTRMRAGQGAGKLGPGALRGRVIAVDGGADDAVRVVVRQQARRVKKELIWKETSRHQTVRPFTLALPDGQHVRVEPDERARLVNSLEPPVVLEEGVRERHVRLTRGEEVCVVGRIAEGVDASSGYRGKGGGRVMLPPRRGRMLLSTGALERLYGRRVRSARNWLFAWVFCFLLPCWMAFFPFWVNAVKGGPGGATVTSMRRKLVERDKKADFWTDVVTFRIEATGQHFSDWLEPTTGWLEPGARVPVFFAPGWSAYARPGKEPTVDLKDGRETSAFFGVFLGVALMGVFGFGRYVRFRPWWERMPLDEHPSEAMLGEPG